VANAGAGDITGKARSPYIWRSLFTNARYRRRWHTLAQSGFKDAVYAIAPD